MPLWGKTRFAKPRQRGATGKTGNELDEGFAYDVNGNITKTSRYDYNGVLTDSMKFSYTGNRITGSYDKQGDVAAVIDFPGSVTSKTPTYDYNGNETTEPHKQLGIGYNLLNLPYLINWNGLNRKVSYFYTFNGQKLRKTVEDNSTITKIDYCGPFVYETVSGTRSLKYIITPHGRAVKSGSSWIYNYNITDHLGNVKKQKIICPCWARQPLTGRRFCANRSLPPLTSVVLSVQE